MPWFFQQLGCKKRTADVCLDRSSLEPFEIRLLVLNVQQHVVYHVEQPNPRLRLAASFLQSCNLGRILQGLSYLRMST